jgi:hypothetical protein
MTLAQKNHCFAQTPISGPMTVVQQFPVQIAHSPAMYLTAQILLDPGRNCLDRGIPDISARAVR